MLEWRKTKMSETYITVKGPGFESTLKATKENNLEQLTQAVKIRGETARYLKTQYPNFDVIQIKGILNHFLREAKETKRIS